MGNIGFDKDTITRFFKGEYSEKDESYVDEVFNDDSKEEELKHLLLRQFYDFLTEDDIEIKNLEHILHRIHFDINTNLPEQKGSLFEKIIKWSFRIAGIIMLPILVFIGIKMFNETNLKKETWVEINAPAWSRVQFSLPDGTIGWLNSSSSMKYNGNFTSDRRIVLKGEAFFDVSEDNDRPFIVSASEISVKVLGTRFNIASYENENNVEVVLEEGELIFNNEVSDKSYTMSPNDLVTYDKINKNFSTKVVEPNKYLSWTEGKLIFRNDPLDVVARRLERWYNIDVEINGYHNGDLRLRATFIDEGLEEVLDLLKRSLQIDYKIESRNIKPDDIYAKKKVILLPGPK